MTNKNTKPNIYLLFYILSILLIHTSQLICDNKNLDSKNIENKFDEKITSKLTGKWMRADGTYLLTIDKIYPNGLIDAHYFNPASIYIKESKIRLIDNNQIEIFIKFQDKRYPGSYYQLVYDQMNNILKGIYYHAILKQSFNIYFIKLKK